MAAYTPSELSALALVALAIAAILGGGHALANACSARVARPIAWSLLALGTLALERFVDREPPGVRMVALIAFALSVMKVIVVIEERARGMAPLSFRAWLEFA